MNAQSAHKAGADQSSPKFDALVLGAGFGGLHMVHELRSKGLTVLGLEAGSDVGGAWYWNRYPGARCDVESLVYSYTFSPVIDAEWKWSERYAAQPEIQRYLKFVCDRLDLRKEYKFNTRLVAASYSEADNCWNFKTEAGDSFCATYFVSAAGPISAPIWPDISGREKFRGQLIHTALWPADVTADFSGKRVGVLGTGSSGTQLIPVVAETAKELVAFVRTPNFYSPARNRPLTEFDYKKWSEIKDRVRAKLRTFEVVGSGDVFMSEEMMATRNFPSHHFSAEERKQIMDSRWEFGGTVMPRAFSDILTNKDANDEVSNYLRAKVAEVVKDPVKAQLLTPRGFSFGTKRICVGTHFYEAFNRENVHILDVKSTPIEQVSEKGVVVGGQEIELDVLICASGFDALTGALTGIDVKGTSGQTIKEAWANGVCTYLGIGIPGFPNFFMIGGPESPSVLVNVVMGNEYQVEWISRLICHMQTHDLKVCKVEPQCARDWSATVKGAIKGTVLEGAESWYVGVNVPGKKREILAYAGGIKNYIAACEKVAKDGYSGFEIT